jgi:hypothetical protein
MRDDVMTRPIWRMVGVVTLALVTWLACHRRAEKPARAVAEPLIEDGDWFLAYRTKESVSPMARGPLQCEVDALWAARRSEVEASGARAATFAVTHYEWRILWVGWRPMIAGDITVFLNFERMAGGKWRKGAGWTAQQCSS